VRKKGKRGGGGIGLCNGSRLPDGGGKDRFWDKEKRPELQEDGRPQRVEESAHSRTSEKKRGWGSLVSRRKAHQHTSKRQKTSINQPPEGGERGKT